MKIAMIGHKRIPSREGGVEIVVEELATRLVEQGNQVDAYNRQGQNVQDKNADADKKKINNYKGVKIITIPTINKKGIDALLYSFLATVRAMFGKYDVLHYHAEGSCAMLWIPRMFRKKIVVTIHGLDWQRSKWGGFATKYIKFGEKLAAKYADEIIVLSKGVQKYFKDTYNRDTHFIPNGVNEPTIREPKIIKEKYGLNKDDYILFLARIVPEKGLHYLIEAFKQIKTNKKLVIAGGASHTNDYLEKIKYMVKDDDRIIMTGFVQGEEHQELFSNCCIYCLPSDIEGMPISLLEAMSYGCNCLVSDIEENTQVTNGGAPEFKKGDVHDLKEKIETMLNDDSKASLEKQKEMTLKKYSWNKNVEDTKELYNNINKVKTTNKIGNISLIISIVLLIIMNIVNHTILKLTLYTLSYTCMYVFLLSNNAFNIMSVPSLFSIFHMIYIGYCPPLRYIRTGLLYENQYNIVLISYLLLIIICTLLKNLITNNKEINQKCVDKAVKINNKKYITLCISLVATSLITTIIYAIKNSAYLFGGDLENGRVTSLQGNGLLLYAMWLGIIGVAMLFEQVLKGKFNKKMFIGIFIITAVATLVTGYRSRLIGMILILVLIYNKWKKIEIKKLIPLGIVIVVLGTTLGLARGMLSDGERKYGFIETIGIYLDNGSENIDILLKHFPNKIPFQNGYTFLINIMMLKPGPDLDFTLWLKQQVNMTYDGGGLTPTILGEFYINWGNVGIFVGFVILGIILAILDKYYKNSSNIYFSSFLLWILLSGVRGGFANVEINLILFGLVYAFVYIVSLEKKEGILKWKK